MFVFGQRLGCRALLVDLNTAGIVADAVLFCEKQEQRARDRWYHLINAVKPRPSFVRFDTTEYHAWMPRFL